MPVKSGLHGDSTLRRHVNGFVLTESFYPPALAIARHDHEQASLCLVLAGGYEEGYGRHRRRAQPGVVIVHPAGEHHDELHDPVATRLLTIELAPALLQGLRCDVRLFDESWHRTDYAAAACAYRLCAELARDHSASDLVIESALLALIADLERARLPDAGKSAWLGQVRDRLEADFAQPPTMTQLAHRAGVHPVHLARAFRRRFGCSIGAYVRRLQVGKAALLLEEDGALAMVAHEAGFADQSHMTRRILAETGLTPGAWRRRTHGRPQKR